MNHKHPSTSFRVRGKELRVDFLTPMIGKERHQPVYLPHLHTAADPLRFLDYLIEDPQQGVVIANRAILVTVPSAGRYALHKLIVSQIRQNRAKAPKDVHQAAQLSKVLLETRPGDLSLAWKALQARGRGWVQHFTRGLEQLTKSHPDIGSEIKHQLLAD